MAIRSLTNEKDVKQINDAAKGGSRDFIKLDKKTFIRLMSKDFQSEFVHSIMFGGTYHPVVCLGGVEKGGYDPEGCPFCAKAKTFWDKMKELKASKNANSKRVKAEIEDVKKKGKKLQTQLRTVMAAVKGEAIRERVDGKLTYTPEFEKEVKILGITPAQWSKLTQNIFDDFAFMKTTEDLLNRDLLFKKVEKKGKKDDKYTAVEIEPMARKSKSPTIDNELPDIDSVFEHLKEDDMKKLLKEFLNSSEFDDEDDDDLEEDDDDIDEDDDDIDEDDDDIDEDEEEEEQPKRKRQTRKKTTRKSRRTKDEDLDVDDTEDDDEDDDF